MSENQEPTMEEILASIRRIISEDDVPAEPVAEAAPPPPAPKAEAPKPEPVKAAPPPPAPEPEPVVFSAPADEPAPLVFDEDVLELTDRLDDPLDLPEALSMSDLEVVEPPPPPRAAPAPSESLVSNFAAGAAASAFDKLERTVMMPVGDRSLEDVVREMLRPMLKAWLDENLPAIVEAQVAAEVERIARQRR